MPAYQFISVLGRVKTEQQGWYFHWATRTTKNGAIPRLRTHYRRGNESRLPGVHRELAIGELLAEHIRLLVNQD